jgi:hypothetical protein
MPVLEQALQLVPVLEQVLVLQPLELHSKRLMQSYLRSSS